MSGNRAPCISGDLVQFTHMSGPKGRYATNYKKSFTFFSCVKAVALASEKQKHKNVYICFLIQILNSEMVLAQNACPLEQIVETEFIHFIGMDQQFWL